MDNNDRWFRLKGERVKNPTKEQLANCETEEIIEFIVGNDNIVIEEWWVELGHSVISFGYSADEDIENVNATRRTQFKNLNIDPKFLKSYTLPKEYFEEITLLY